MSRPTRQVRPLFSAEEVQQRIQALADGLAVDFAGARPVIVSIAEGARRFTAALVEALQGRGVRAEVVSIRARRTSGTRLGALQVEALDVRALEGRDVLVVDDIVDEGRTLVAVLELVELAETRSLRTAVLVEKLARRREPLILDYVGFEVQGGWVVGFGMDVDGELRDLDEIGVLVESAEPTQT